MNPKMVKTQTVKDDLAAAEASKPLTALIMSEVFSFHIQFYSTRTIMICATFIGLAR